MSMLASEVIASVFNDMRYVLIFLSASTAFWSTAPWVIGDWAEDAHLGNLLLLAGLAAFGAAERPAGALNAQADNPTATSVGTNDREIFMRSTPAAGASAPVLLGIAIKGRRGSATSGIPLGWTGTSHRSGARRRLGLQTAECRRRTGMKRLAEKDQSVL